MKLDKFDSSINVISLCLTFLDKMLNQLIGLNYQPLFKMNLIGDIS